MTIHRASKPSTVSDRASGEKAPSKGRARRAAWWSRLLNRIDPTRRRLGELERRVEELEAQTRKHAVLLGKSYSSPGYSAHPSSPQKQANIVELLEALLRMSENARPPGEPSLLEREKDKA